jgi:predicted transcriptional regulator
MTQAVRYSHSITIRCQPEVAGMVDHAARARGQKPAEWTRQALLAALRANGLDPARAGAAEANANPESLPRVSGRHPK